MSLKYIFLCNRIETEKIYAKFISLHLQNFNRVNHSKIYVSRSLSNSLSLSNSIDLLGLRHSTFSNPKHHSFPLKSNLFPRPFPPPPNSGIPLLIPSRLARSLSFLSSYMKSNQVRTREERKEGRSSFFEGWTNESRLT